MAFVEADLLERVAPALKAHFESKDALVQWKRKDEFGQPLLLRLVETGDEQIIDLIIKHVASADVASVVYVSHNPPFQFLLLSHALLTFCLPCLVHVLLIEMTIMLMHFTMLYFQAAR